MTEKNPEWPSVEEQLREAKVAPGTALEKLILDNQDFHLLQPEEAHDDAGIPLWLRVYWRKNHPDIQHPTVNPGAGYPDILYDILARMLANPDLPWGTQAEPQGPQTPPAPVVGEAAGTPGKKGGTS